MKSIGSDFLCSGLESRRKSTVFSTVRDACVGNDGNSSKDSYDDDNDEEFDDGEGGGREVRAIDFLTVLCYREVMLCHCLFLREIPFYVVMLSEDSVA